ncbi:hypothetical protein SAMN06265360_13013 [Haloechinothrix alba]|uniref:Uncharacterized protein n=1 Tax=Haloechinothrix alba TaxID=664784 RepID=A0A239A3T8_9PSEU|nr:hypothetical protein SAMN06265360_13013 [Haloechinothrix alba]
MPPCRFLWVEYVRPTALREDVEGFGQPWHEVVLCDRHQIASQQNAL